VLLAASGKDITLKARAIGTAGAGTLDVGVSGVGKLIIDSTQATGDVYVDSDSALLVGNITTFADDEVLIRSLGTLGTSAAIGSGGILTLQGENVHFGAHVTAKSLTVLAGTIGDAAYDKTITALSITESILTTTAGDLTLRGKSVLDNDGPAAIKVAVGGGNLVVDADGGAGNVMILSSAALALGDIDLLDAGVGTITTGGALTTGTAITSSGTLLLKGNVVTISNNVTAKVLTIDSSSDGTAIGDVALVVASGKTLATSNGNMTLKALTIGHADGGDGNTDANVTVVGGDLFIQSNSGTSGDVAISSAAALELGTILLNASDTATIQTTGVSLQAMPILPP